MTPAEASLAILRCMLSMGEWVLVVLRWAGVPWIMKAGKALNERKVEIRVQYKPPAASIHGDVINEMRNELVVRIVLRSNFHGNRLRMLFSPVNALLPYRPPICVRAISQPPLLQHLQLTLLAYALENHDDAVCKSDVLSSSICA